MPLKDPEARKAYERERSKNRVPTDASRKYDREWKRRFYQTPKGKKKLTFDNWKKGGLVGDYEAVYEIYLNTTNCMRCSIQFCVGNRKSMDHDHETGEYRAVLCNTCNAHNPDDKTIRKDNSLGIPNINPNQGGYVFSKSKNKKRHQKWFKTLEEAIKYKEQYIACLA